MSENPYSAPSDFTESPAQNQFRMDPADRKKIDAIIKDAGQFWLAILLCFFCAVLAAIIVPIWYTTRLIQCSALVGKYPELNQPGPNGSLQNRFQNAKIKLIIGLILGCLISGLVILMIVAPMLLFG